MYVDLGHTDDAERMFIEADTLLNQLGHPTRRNPGPSSIDLHNDWGVARAGLVTH